MTRAAGNLPGMRFSRRSLLLLALVIAVVAGGLFGIVLRGMKSAAAESFRGSEPPAGIVAPDFVLRDYKGEVVRMRDLRGKAVAVTFLDTQCTEACPIIATQIGKAFELLRPDERAEIVALAITTDPEEDTPASIRIFLRRHRAGDDLRYLVGSERELRPVWKAFHILPSLDTGEDDVHSAPVRVFDRDGRWVSTLHSGADLTPENLAHDLRAALEG